MADDWDKELADDLPPPPTTGGRAGEAAVLPFTTIAGYEVGPELGRGGMGVVYSATHQKLGRKVALKFVLSGVFAHRKERERFLAEARTTAALQHPNIIQIHDVGEFGATPFMALEFVDGGSLAELIARQPLPDRRAAEIVAALARAVAFAHSKNVIHRDLKPANVFMAAAGPKLGDFGVAKIHEEAAAGSGTMTGTPSYMAPEQAAGRPVTPSADIYALGAVLYECVTSRPPFKAATVAETIRQVVESDPVDPRSLQPNLSKDLDTIILKCLEKDPARRYPTADALADDLDRFLAGRPIVARPIGRPERVWRWMKLHPRDSLLIITALVALLGGTLGIYLQYRQTVFQFNRAEGKVIESEDRRKEAEAAKQIAVERQKELEQAIDNIVYLVGIIDLDQLFGMRMLHVDPELLRPALKANERFLEEHESTDEREPEVVAAMFRVALLTRIMGDRPKALKLSFASLERQEKFVAANPEVTQYKRDLAAMYHNVGFLLHDANRSEEALNFLAKARRIRDEFIESQSDNLDYRSELAGCLNDIGLAWVGRYELQKDPAFVASAEQAFVSARDHQRTVVQKAGHVPRYRTLLGNHLYNLARLQANAGRKAEAAATAEELQREQQYEPEAKIRAARINALLAPQAGPQAKDFETRAIELLAEAYADAATDQGIAFAYPEFASLQKRAEFVALRKRFDKNATSPRRGGAPGRTDSSGSTPGQ